VATAVITGLVAAVAMLPASGAIGPGRMTELGAPALLVGGVVALEVLVGSLLVVLPTDRLLRAATAQALLRGWQRLRRR